MIFFFDVYYYSMSWIWVSESKQEAICDENLFAKQYGSIGHNHAEQNCIFRLGREDVDLQ